MSQIKSKDIKEKFLTFFEKNHHYKINSSSIIPKNDPTLLFINSGMAPLKNFFTGEEQPPSTRLCNVQPCIRTIDIDEVGDNHHLTSFQMLGSWSIGDYFKGEAIKLAYLFLTQCLAISKENLYVTIFKGDKNLGLKEDIETKQHWLDMGISEDHIVSCGKKDNFWGPTSETGPCGPCTEVFYDLGDSKGEKYSPGKPFDTKKRYIEIWNAGVFMQFYKHKDGSYSPLKFKSVDTGAGLERLSMVINKKDSVYETDLLLPIKNKIIDFLNNINSKDIISEKEILIMTDHLRTITLILSEGVKISNEGRGYIPRKLIRKCILIIAKANIADFNFIPILEFIIDNYKEIFLNFYKKKEYILSEFQKEYDQFIKVITIGLKKLHLIRESKSNIDSTEIFDLVTTFGLPFDIIKDFAIENKLSLDEHGFNKKLLEHKNISKIFHNSKNIIKNLEYNFLKNIEPTIFEGYKKLDGKSYIIKMIDNKNNFIEFAKKGDKVILILKNTCFYAESGGQCSDIGLIYNKNFKIQVNDVQKTNNNVYLHFGEILEGQINLNNNFEINLNINRSSRQKLSNNHTTVHLLHSALRNLFGNELHQSGSKVETDKLRFDFNYDGSISLNEIFKLENIVNENIQKNIQVKTEIKPLDEAIKDGALALFDNKYSDKVRVISIKDISKELCGGTHTSFTGNIGFFAILSVEGIGKGIKRITAVTGQEAVKYFHDQSLVIKDLTKILGVKPEKIIDKITSLKEKKQEKVKAHVKELSYQIYESQSGFRYAFISNDQFDKNQKDNIISLSDKINGIVFYLGGKDIKQLLIAVSQNYISKYAANRILSLILNNISGKGGGSPRIASGGGIKINDESLLAIIDNL